ncbi:MAG: hypothetical protein ACT4TC_01300 [Myxococcaceae bacterium]
MSASPIPSSKSPVSLPAKVGLSVQASSNDATQHLSIDNGDIIVSGTADGNGVVPSFAELSFDGRKVSVPLSSGMDPAATVAALRAALPPGYRIVERPNTLLSGEVFAVVKDVRKSRPQADREQVTAGGTLALAHRRFDEAVQDGVVTAQEVETLIAPHCQDMFEADRYRERVSGLVYSVAPEARLTGPAKDALEALLDCQSAGQCPLPAKSSPATLWENVDTANLAEADIASAPAAPQSLFEKLLAQADGIFVSPPKFFVLEQDGAKSLAIEQQDDSESTLYVFDESGAFQGKSTAYWVRLPDHTIVVRLPRRWDAAAISGPNT